GWKGIAEVYVPAGAPGERTADRLVALELQLLVTPLSHRRAGLAPVLGFALLEDSAAVIGNIVHHLHRWQEKVAPQVTPGQDHMPDVDGVVGDETIAPGIQGVAELGRARIGLEPAPVQTEAEVRAQHRYRRD